MSDLDKLIEAVEGGFPDYALLEYDGFCDTFKHDFRDAYHGSLDAAKALHEVLLPGWFANLEIDRNFAVVNAKRGLRQRGFSALSSSPARAWLIATLKACRAQQETQE